jgi:phage portal protein BeeE
MNLLPWKRKTEERDSQSMNFQEWVELFKYQGNFYPLSSLNQTLRGNREQISSTFTGLTQQVLQSNSVVFACMEARRSIFSEASFLWRARVKGRPGDLFSTPELDILRTPWPGGTTGKLLSRMIQDVDLAGNCYLVRDGNTIRRLRPDWIEIILGSNSGTWVEGDFDTQPIGYMYFPGGIGSGEPPKTFELGQIAHFAPVPDPVAWFRGMSFLTAVIREVQSDSMMTEHKTKFMENGATPNLIVKFPEETTRDDFDEAVEIIKRDHEGFRNAYKTLFLAGGADAQAVGVDMQQFDFRAIQGAGETRIAAVLRTPPVIVGLSEGLQGSSLNAGNYQAARRMFADGTMRPLWREAAGALSQIVRVPERSELFYDERDVSFLKEDLKDIAQVQKMQGEAASSYFNAGWEPDSIIEALAADDITRLLKNHTGAESVQVQQGSSGTEPAMNGKGTAVPALPV